MPGLFISTLIPRVLVLIDEVFVISYGHAKGKKLTIQGGRPVMACRNTLDSCHPAISCIEEEL